MRFFVNHEVFMTIEQLARFLDNEISTEYSEAWDNDGRMVVPNPDDEVTKVLCALDCTSEAIKEAKKLGCNVIVTHHPLIFKPLASLRTDDSVGKRVVECIKSGISVLSYHTRLDVIENGVNDTLAGLLGIENASSFLPYGRIGDVCEQSFCDFAKSVAEKLGLEAYELSLVNASNRVKRVALVSGCGKDEIVAAISAGADTFVTGEVMHNHMIDCKELNLNLVCGTHYATERIILPKLSEISMMKKLKMFP